MTVFVCAAVGALALVQTAAATPAVGVQFHATWSDYTPAQRTEVLDKMQAAGVKWVRIDLGWASLQESPDAYSSWYVNLADSAVDAARARGINVLMTLWATPGWANGGAPTSTPPSDVAAYARAAQWAAAHFRGRVAAWEIWNEPNLAEFYTGTPAQYASLLRVAYPAVKTGDPAAKVVLGGPSTNDVAWLRQVYAAGIRDSYDVMSTHPYQGMADAPPETADDGQRWNLTHITAVHDLMVQQGDGAKEIWFTEFGWSSHDNAPGVENWNRGVTLAQQGDYLVRTIQFVARQYPYVTNIFWYDERNASGSGIQNDNYGLLYHDLSPKPAYSALKAFLTAPPAPAPTPTAPPVPVVPTPVVPVPVVPVPVPVAAPPVAPAPAPAPVAPAPAPAPPAPAPAPVAPAPPATPAPSASAPAAPQAPPAAPAKTQAAKAKAAVAKAKAAARAKRLRRLALARRVRR